MNIRYKIASEVGSFLAEKSQADNDKKERIIYGSWNLLTIIMFLLVLLIIRLIFSIGIGIDIPVFTIYIAFSTLRTVLGGFHLNNTTYCFVSTIIIIITTSIVAKFVHIMLIWMLFIYIISFIAIYFVGVVDSEKKKFSNRRKVKYRKIGLSILSLICIINLFIYFNDNIVISNAVAIGVLIEVVNLVYAKCNK